MKQAVFIIATSIALASPAYADFRAGIEAGRSSTSYPSLGAGGTIEGTSIGVFGQWRVVENEKFDIWAHLGYLSDSSSTMDEYGTIGIYDGDLLIIDNFTLKMEVDSVIDLMGVVSWKGGAVNPFIMAGLSAIEIGNTASGTIDGSDAVFKHTGDDTETGLKLSIGAEFWLDKDWKGYVRMDYADYGTVRLFNKLIEFETEQTGIRVGAIYNF